MKKKMKRYEDGGEVEFESKVGPNSSIDEMTRIRAQDYAEEMQRPAPEIETKEAPKAKAKAAPKKKDAVYSPKSLPESDREENSAFMRKFRKDEAKAKDEPSFLKGTKGFKNLGEAFKAMRRSAGITSYKSGGSVSSASKRADGCAVKGKTRGKMV
jgi:hypothetical protein